MLNQQAENAAQFVRYIVEGLGKPWGVTETVTLVQEWSPVSGPDVVVRLRHERTRVTVGFRYDTLKVKDFWDPCEHVRRDYLVTLMDLFRLVEQMEPES